MTRTAPYLIATLCPADLTPSQLTGAACVYCHATDTLAYAGWLRIPLAPHRTLSAPVAACALCRPARSTPDPEEPH